MHNLLSYCFRLLFLCLGLKILTQPKNVVCKPGEESGFSIKTSKTAPAYQWYLNGNKISIKDKDYKGCTTEELSISKCLPKHKGSYKCFVTTESDTLLISEIATLKIGNKFQACMYNNGILFF